MYSNFKHLLACDQFKMEGSIKLYLDLKNGVMPGRNVKMLITFKQPLPNKYISSGFNE